MKLDPDVDYATQAPPNAIDDTAEDRAQETQDERNAKFRDGSACRLAQQVQDYVDKRIKMILEKMKRMPVDSRFVLLVPAELFFHVTLYNFLLTLTRDSKQYIQNGPSKNDKQKHLAEQVHEMKVYTDFMQIFVPFYIHPTYAETESVVARRSTAFFSYHKPFFDSVPRNELFITCLNGSEKHASMQNQISIMQSGRDVSTSSGVFTNTGLRRSIPPLVRPTIQNLLHLVEIVRKTLKQHIQNVIQQFLCGSIDTVSPPMIKDDITIRDILVEIVGLIQESLVGNMKTEVEIHANYISSILATHPIQHNAQFLIFVLDSIQLRLQQLSQ